MLEIIAFDADDTLWHNEIFYQYAKERFKLILSNYVEPEFAERTLDEVEEHNVRFYGYGLKSFSLSMVETAVRLSAGKLEGGVIEEVLTMTKDMLKADPEHFSNVTGIPKKAKIL